MRRTYLHAGPESQVGIAGVAHLEDAAEPVLGEVADLEDLELGRYGAEVELGDEDIVDDDRGFRGLVEGGGEQVPGARVEVGVGRQRRPVEVEGHVEMAATFKGPLEMGFEVVVDAARRGTRGWFDGWRTLISLLLELEGQL